MAKPTVVTDITFDSEVIGSNVPVLVDFWAVWCGPCRMIAPIVDEIAKDYDGKIKVMKLDVDENQNTTMNFGVMGIPTLILFKDGKAVERITGYMPKERLLAKLLPHMN
ncbi:MAG TPA: thioredoxin [Anaerolineae bacterium]|nr:thioredoxin [Anaerolineae bacterium]